MLAAADGGGSMNSALVDMDKCDVIKQNESEVENHDFWYFGIFY